MSTILEVLRKAQEEGQPRPGPGAMPDGLLETERSRRRRRWAWAAVASVLAGGFASGWWIGSRPSSEAVSGLAADGAVDSRVAVARNADEDAAPLPAPASAHKREAAADPSAQAAGPSAVAAGSAPGAARAPGASAAGVAQPNPGAVAPPGTAPSSSGAEPQAPAAPRVPSERPPAAVVSAPGARQPGPGAGTQAALRAADPGSGDLAAATPPLAADVARAPIGERRPPAYLEQRIGPGGPEGVRLRPVERPKSGNWGDLGAEPSPPEPVKPAPVVVDARPAAARQQPPESPASFREAEEVRLADAARTAPPPAEVVERPGRRRLARPGDAESVEAAPDHRDAPARGGVEERVTLAAVPAPAAPPAPRPDSGLSGMPAHALRHPPYGAPQVTINIVQWSAAPERRFAYVRVDGSQMRQVREGDQVGGLTVKQIFQQAIEFGHGDSSFVLRAN